MSAFHAKPDDLIDLPPQHVIAGFLCGWAFHDVAP
jgi:hypothetical protein